MNQSHIIIGLGQTGISVAKYLHARNIAFSVADTRENPPQLAEFKALFPDVLVHLGDLSSEVLSSASILVVSPGVAISHPAIESAKEKGARIIGDIELFAERIMELNANPMIVGITGANGKSTVTTIVGKMIEDQNLKVTVAGNIGIPILSTLDESAISDYYVLELSSFQLETTYSLPLRTATILNITPDHMDRYADIREYANAKQRIYQNCIVAVYNRHDPLTFPMQKKVEQVISFGLDEPQEGQFGIRFHQGDQYLALGKQNLMAAKELKIIGQHNVANALASLALGCALKLDMAKMLMTLKSFKGLSHRCEWISNAHGFTWINDSKGTNGVATLAAIEGIGAQLPLNKKIVLIAGGDAKGASFEELTPSIERFVRAVLLIGRDADKIAKAVPKTIPVHNAGKMESAISKVSDFAQSGDIVLLSPACASLDQYKNYMARGQDFIDCINRQYR